MQESLTVQFSPSVIQEVLNGSVHALLIELEKSKEKIIELLVGYHFSERQRVFDVQILETSPVLDGQGRGSFVISYMLGLFNACADLDHSSAAKMKIEICINPESGEAVLTGEYFPERGPDEF